VIFAAAESFSSDVWTVAGAVCFIAFVLWLFGAFDR
jgi:hypothetical protein